MVVHLVDPAAYTPPYDHLLARALAEQGLDVHLFTTRFRYGPTPAPERYRRHELFYPGRSGRGARLLGHPASMVRYLRAAAAADIVHFQWLAAQPFDLPALLAWRRHPPLVLTAHDILPREGLPGQRQAQRLLYRRFARVVVHSSHGRRRLEGLGVEPERIAVIGHPALEPLLAPGERVELPPELPKPTGPVVLFAGVLRPYKGLDLLARAWELLASRGKLGGAVLWIAGHPRVDPARLIGTALPPDCALLPRFLREGELAALLEAATLVVLPYRELDASGAALLAVGAGKPLVVSDAGSFPELAALGVARCFESGNAEALAAAIGELLADRQGRERLAQAARQAAAGPLSWERAASRTAELYRRLAGGG